MNKLLNINEFFKKNKIVRFFALLFLNFTIVDIQSKANDYNINLLSVLFLSLIFLGVSVYLIFLGYEILYEITSIAKYQIDLPFNNFLIKAFSSTLLVAFIFYIKKIIFNSSLQSINNHFILLLIVISSIIELIAYLALITIIGSRSMNEIYKKFSLFFDNSILNIYSIILFIIILIIETLNFYKIDFGDYTFLIIYYKILAGIMLFSICLTMIKKWQIAYFSKKTIT